MNKTKKEVENYYYGSPVKIAEKILFIKRETVDSWWSVVEN